MPPYSTLLSTAHCYCWVMSTVSTQGDRLQGAKIWKPLLTEVFSNTLGEGPGPSIKKSRLYSTTVPPHHSLNFEGDGKARHNQKLYAKHHFLTPHSFNDTGITNCLRPMLSSHRHGLMITELEKTKISPKTLT